MITNRTVLRVIGIAVAVAVALFLLYRMREVLGLLVMAVFVAIALAPLVNFIEAHTPIPRVGAILASYLVLLVGIFGVGLLIVPPIVDEVDSFVKDLPTYVQDIRESDTLREYDEKYGVVEELERQADKLPTLAEDAGNALKDVTVGLFTALFKLVTVLVIAAFLLIDGRSILGFFYRRLDEDKERRARAMAADINKAVGGYVVGVLCISLIASTTTYIVLLILGVPFAVPLAVLMAFMVLIPLVGATIAGVIIGIVAALHSFPVAPIVWIIWLILYQQVENHVLQPQIYKRTVSLHPLLVIVGVLVGASLLGIVGALLAIPAAATIQIFVREWWRYRHGEPPPEGPGDAGEAAGDDPPPPQPTGKAAPEPA